MTFDGFLFGGVFFVVHFHSRTDPLRFARRVAGNVLHGQAKREKK